MSKITSPSTSERLGQLHSSRTLLTMNMSKITRPPTFERLGQLPPEVRSMVFEYMIRHQSREHDLVLNTHQVRCHLATSPWITRNKQYCAEYLRTFLKQVELRADISNEMWDLQAPKRGAISEINHCLKIIEARLRVCDTHFDPKDPTDGIGNYMRGLSLSLFSLDGVILDAGYNMAQEDLWFVERIITTPLEQMRRLHEKHNIPAHKLYVRIKYDKLGTAFAGFLYRQQEPIDNYDSLRPVQARIYVADHDASVASIDEGLRTTRRKLVERLKETLHRFPLPDPRLGDMSTLETRIEEEMVKIRESHVMTSETITRLWKAQSMTP
ncbi:hypothetical protein M436DRAFT_68018 [Aureobasidium namibiae CBS 147.97]|uniref:Uncharacterized protein n=1 Tax=Aureobasidium namibiae CBS 147.97 TaxID=1043004 RepID=A0A074WF66_9PEZI